VRFPRVEVETELEAAIVGPGDQMSEFEIAPIESEGAIKTATLTLAINKPSNPTPLEVMKGEPIQKGLITGQVRNHQGAGVAGARVFLGSDRREARFDPHSDLVITDSFGRYTLSVTYKETYALSPANVLVVCASRYKTFSLSLDECRPKQLEVSPTLEREKTIIVHAVLPPGMQPTDLQVGAVRWGTLRRFATFRMTREYLEPVAVFENARSRMVEHYKVDGASYLEVMRKDGCLADYWVTVTPLPDRGDGHDHYVADLRSYESTSLTLTNQFGREVAVPVIDVHVNESSGFSIPACCAGHFEFWSKSGELEITPTYLGVQFTPDSMTLHSGSKSTRVVHLEE
jgi:hypothetical protein